VKHQFKLRSNFRPEAYRLKLLVNPRDKTLEGTVVITGKKTGRPSRRLTFHQKKLKVTDAVITYFDKQGSFSHELARINHHKSFQQVRLHSRGMLYPGSYKVKMRFSSPFKLAGDPEGVIRQRLKDGGVSEIFPSIDESVPDVRLNLKLIK